MHGTTFGYARPLFSYVADWVFRRDRQRAWNRMADRGFTGSAEFFGRSDRQDGTRSFDRFAYTAAHRSGDTPGGVPLDAGVVGGERAAERENLGHGWYDAGGECSHAFDCATR